MKSNSSTEAKILMGAFDNAGSELSLSISDKAKILGVHPSTFLRRKLKGYNPQSKVGELQLHFIQLYKALYRVSSGDKALMQHWYKCTNKTLHASPKVLCQSIHGLISTKQYIEALQPRNIVLSTNQ